MPAVNVDEEIIDALLDQQYPEKTVNMLANGIEEKQKSLISLFV